MKSGPTRAEKEALRILAGCQQGATEASLRANGVGRATLDNLVRARRVTTWVERLYKPRIDVTWFALAREEE